MQRRPPTIDLLPDGRVRPARPTLVGPALSLRLLVGAALVAAIAGALSLAALAISILSLLVPVAVFAGFVAWATMRWRRWRAGLGSGRSVFR